jgi:hypothetical protein
MIGLSLVAAVAQSPSWAQGRPGNAPRIGDPAPWNGRSPLELKQGYTLFQYLGVDINNLLGATPAEMTFNPTNVVTLPDYQIVHITYCPKRVVGGCSYQLSDTKKVRLYNTLIFAVGRLPKVNIVEFYTLRLPTPTFGFCFRKADSDADLECLNADEATLREMWPNLADPVKAFHFITYARIFIESRKSRLADAQKPTRLEVARDLGIKEKSCLKLETYAGSPSQTFKGPDEYVNGRYVGQSTYQLPGSSASTIIANTCGIDFYAKISCMGGVDIHFGPQERKFTSVSGVCIASKSDKGN